MISVLPDYNIGASTNCRIIKRYETCEITNCWDENGYAVFPLNSYWNDEFIPSCWELTIKGKFTDTTFCRLESADGVKSEPVYLSDEQSTFTIPMTIFDEKQQWSRIFFGLGKNDSIIISDLRFCPENFYRKNRIPEVYHMTDPIDPRKSIWCKREKGYFTETNHITDSTIVWCKPQIELVTTQERDKIWFKLDKIQENSNAKIINHISTMYTHSLKDRAFLTWEVFGLPAPKYEMLDGKAMPRVVKEWVHKYKNKGFIIRLNNKESGKACELWNSKNRTQYSHMETMKWRDRSKGYYGNDIMFVENIPPTKIQDKLYKLGGKAFIVNGKIICCVPDAFNYNGKAVRGGYIQEANIFIEAAKRVQSISKEWKHKMVVAVNAVGLQVATLDFLLGPDGNPIFLEANSSWGLSSGFVDFPFSDKLKNVLIEDRKVLEPVIPDVYKRMDLDKFWSEVYKWL